MQRVTTSDSKTDSESDTRSRRTSSRRQSDTETGREHASGTVFSPPTPDHLPLRQTPLAEEGVTQRDLNIQRAMDGTGTSQEEVPDVVLEAIGRGGMPLDPTVQESLEARMGADFSDVRIHTGAKAAEAADAIDAKAFTCGNSIVFNSGEYDPQSAEGQFLLAHELAHVTQQNGGAPLSMMPQENADLEIDLDPQLERDADRAAQEALSGDEPLTVSRMGTDVHVQRAPKFTDYVASSEAQEKFLDSGGQGELLDTDPEKLERLQNKVDELEEIATRIDELGDEMEVAVSPSENGTTITEQTSTPLDDGMSLTVSSDADLESLDLSSEQKELVREHRDLIDEFGNTVEELIADLQGEIDDERTLREVFKELSIEMGAAAILYEAIEMGTDYHTLAEMLAKESNAVGPQSGPLIENIVLYFGAFLTAAAVKEGYDRLTTDDTGDYPGDSE